MMNAVEKRAAAHVIESYIAQLHSNGEGPQHTAAWLEAKIKELKKKVQDQNKTWIQRLRLLQRIGNYEYELETLGPSDLRSEFIKVVAAWSEENGIEPWAWIELKVPRSVLKEAGL